MALTNAEIALLAVPKVKKGRGANMAWVKTVDPTNDAIHSIELVSVKQGEIGKFEGKAGTVVTNRKGNRRRKLNGQRYYEDASWFTSSGRPQVVAYTASTVTK